MSYIEVIAKVIRAEFYEDDQFHEMELRCITEKHAKDIVKALNENGFMVGPAYD